MCVVYENESVGIHEPLGISILLVMDRMSENPVSNFYKDMVDESKGADIVVPPIRIRYGVFISDLIAGISFTAVSTLSSLSLCDDWASAILFVSECIFSNNILVSRSGSVDLIFVIFSCFFIL